MAHKEHLCCKVGSTEKFVMGDSVQHLSPNARVGIKKTADAQMTHQIAGSFVAGGYAHIFEKLKHHQTGLQNGVIADMGPERRLSTWKRARIDQVVHVVTEYLRWMMLPCAGIWISSVVTFSLQSRRISSVEKTPQ